MTEYRDVVLIIPLILAGVGVMTGFGVAFLIAPPTYGPRLVEAAD